MSNNYLIWGFASKVRLGLLGTGGGLDVIVGMCWDGGLTMRLGGALNTLGAC